MDDVIRREIDVYAARVEAERRSQDEPSDEAADNARSAAPEARPDILEPVAAKP